MNGFGDAYQPAARALKRYWDAGKATPDRLQPCENAENVAAAALGK